MSVAPFNPFFQIPCGIAPASLLYPANAASPSFRPFSLPSAALMRAGNSVKNFVTGIPRGACEYLAFRHGIDLRAVSFRLPAIFLAAGKGRNKGDVKKNLDSALVPGPASPNPKAPRNERGKGKIEYRAGDKILLSDAVATVTSGGSDEELITVDVVKLSDDGLRRIQRGEMPLAEARARYGRSDVGRQGRQSPTTSAPKTKPRERKQFLRPLDILDYAEDIGFNQNILPPPLLWKGRERKVKFEGYETDKDGSGYYVFKTLDDAELIRICTRQGRVPPVNQPAKRSKPKPEPEPEPEPEPARAAAPSRFGEIETSPDPIRLDVPTLVQKKVVVGTQLDVGPKKNGLGGKWIIRVEIIEIQGEWPEVSPAFTFKIVDTRDDVLKEIGLYNGYLFDTLSSLRDRVGYYIHRIIHKDG